MSRILMKFRQIKTIFVKIFHKADNILPLIKTETEGTFWNSHGAAVVVDTDRLQVITFYEQFDVSFYHIYINKLTSDRAGVIQFT